MHRLTLSLAAVLVASATALAQVHVIPNGTAAVAGNSVNAFPWGTTASGFPGLRLMAVYDSTNFTAASITTPILISRLRWRVNDVAITTTWTGGVFTSGTVRMSTAAVDWSAVTTNFATNHGPDLITCYTGPVTYLPGAGLGVGVPGMYVVDITLTTPFLYDPSGGDLNIDVDYPGGTNFVGGSVQSVDVQTTGALASRVYASSLYPAANGITTNHGPVVEVTYAPAVGAATGTPYGTGCYDRSVSFYENFVPPSSFDLGSTTGVNSVRMVPNGQGGYTVTPGSNQWFTPVAPSLTLSAPGTTATATAPWDDAISVPLALPFTFNYPGGSTTSILVASNGHIGLNATGASTNGYPTTTLFLTGGAKLSPLWADLDADPVSGGGTIGFDVDTVNGVVYVTWAGVPVWEAVPTSPRFITNFQVAMYANGVAEFRYQACSVATTAGLTLFTGFSPGGTSTDPGNRDISATLPFSTATDASALRLTGSPRPVLGSTVTLTTTNIPASSSVGATILSFTQHNPGIDLTSIGMPGCRRYVNLDSSQLFFPSGGTGSTTLFIPNNPTYVGVHVFAQSAAFAPGVNPLGVLASNGWDLKVGLL